MFRSAVNYYMNVDFNLSKVMIFTKFYKNYYASRSKNILGSQVDIELDTKSL